MKLQFKLKDSNNKDLSDRFILYDEINKKEINRSEIIERRVNDIYISVLYKCNDVEKCEVDEEDLRNYYQLYFYYNDFIVQPQKNIPIIQKEYFNYEYFIFDSYLKSIQYIRWNIIRFENHKGLSQLFDLNKDEESDNIKEKDIYIGGKFQRFWAWSFAGNSYEGGGLFLFGFNVLNTNFTNEIIYNDYKRKEKSVYDSLANIFSLSITVYNIFSLVFSILYSNNFDKYKIIDIILSKEKENIKKPNIEEKMKDLNDNDNNENLLEKDVSINENSNSDDDNKENDNIEKTSLPKLRYFDFIFNNIYFEKCCLSKKQQLISSCDNIILKYHSIENIIYNQFILENLLLDYKWNNPKLKNIINNKEFNKLKDILIENK